MVARRRRKEAEAVAEPEPIDMAEDTTIVADAPTTDAADEPESDGPPPEDIPPIEPPLEDEIREEMERAVVHLFEWFGILDEALMREIKRVIDVGAPERLRDRVYELIRNRIGTVKLKEIIEVGVEGTLKNIAKLEGGTDTSMSDLA